MTQIKELIKAKNKGGGRVNAREPCASDTMTQYLNIVDVDLAGQIDWLGTYEVSRDVPYRPAD